MRLAATLSGLNIRLKLWPGYMLVIAFVIGLVGGYGAVGFRALIDLFQRVCWQTSSYGIDWVQGLPWYWIVGVPTGGGLFVGLLVHRFAKEARGHGVPEVMEAVALNGGRIRPRVVVVKAVASAMCIATGGSVGREGPIVQIGSAWGSAVGQFLGLGPRRMRTLVGCGAAAGIAATFNAPIAGAFFAVEVILGEFGLPQFSPIVIASVAATVVGHAHFGDRPAFTLPVYELRHPLELIAYVVVGVLAAVVGVAFIRLLHVSEDLFDKSPVSAPLRATVGGAMVGVIALLFPDVFGLGYEAIDLALTGTTTARFLGCLLAAKILASSITLGSGGSGGIFAPSLLMGAMTGGLVGIGVHEMFPTSTAPAGAYALVGMAAVVAATTHAPMTAILILFELTNDYRLILPLMTTCVLATLCSKRLNQDSIYTAKLRRRGINVAGGHSVDLLREDHVRDVMSRRASRVLPSETLAGVMARMSNTENRCLYVVADDGHYSGVITMQELAPVIKDAEKLGNLVVAHDLVIPNGPNAAPDETLEAVLQRMDVGYRDELPVLEDGRMVGVVRIHDILTRYRKQLTRHEIESEMLDAKQAEEAPEPRAS